ARKTDDENSIRRSLVEPNINDDRTIIRNDDDTIGIGQYSIKPDTTDTYESKQLVRSNNHSFKLSEKYNRPASHKVRRTTQKATQILNRVKKQHNKEPIKTYTKSSFNRGSNTFSGGSISRILD
ncbi:relaxase, partial [Klebsiella pneumoniae]|nr:relaxase [Klebsiella pneumoniae]